MYDIWHFRAITDPRSRLSSPCHLIFFVKSKKNFLTESFRVLAPECFAQRAACRVPRSRVQRAAPTRPDPNRKEKKRQETKNKKRRTLSDPPPAVLLFFFLVLLTVYDSLDYLVCFHPDLRTYWGKSTWVLYFHVAQFLFVSIR